MPEGIYRKALRHLIWQRKPLEIDSCNINPLKKSEIFPYKALIDFSNLKYPKKFQLHTVSQELQYPFGMGPLLPLLLLLLAMAHADYDDVPGPPGPKKIPKKFGNYFCYI